MEAIDNTNFVGDYDDTLHFMDAGGETLLMLTLAWSSSTNIHPIYKHFFGQAIFGGFIRALKMSWIEASDF